MSSRFDDLDELLQMFTVSQDRFIAGIDPRQVLGKAHSGSRGGTGADSELCLGGVSGEKIDVCKVSWVALP